MEERGGGRRGGGWGSGPTYMKASPTHITHTQRDTRWYRCYIPVHVMYVFMYVCMFFTEMGAINDGLAAFIDYIAEHVSPRIAGRWDVQGAWCNRYRALACQREYLRITSFLICDLLDYVARTRTSVIRWPILL